MTAAAAQLLRSEEGREAIHGVEPVPSLSFRITGKWGPSCAAKFVHSNAPALNKLKRLSDHIGLHRRAFCDLPRKRNQNSAALKPIRVTIGDEVGCKRNVTAHLSIAFVVILGST
jgi:hypothetical protein